MGLLFFGGQLLYEGGQLAMGTVEACCCVGAFTCDDCSACFPDPFDVQFTATGISNDLCESCGDANTTKVGQAIGDGCAWTAGVVLLAATTNCGIIGNPPVQAQVSVFCNPGNQWSISADIIIDAGSDDGCFLELTGADAMDAAEILCGGGGYAFIMDSEFGTPACNCLGAVLTVTANV